MCSVPERKRRRRSAPSQGLVVPVAATRTSNRSSKMEARATASQDDNHKHGVGQSEGHTGTPLFRATKTAREATSMTDGVLLSAPKNNNPNEDRKLQRPVILPWIGFGTYKLGKDAVHQAVVTALRSGYRCLDTAFIYGGEKTERLVGQAIRTALDESVLRSREEVFVTTKQWRKYHGYDATLECLALSLRRLQLVYVDLYLIHWPGPAWTTMNRRKDLIAEHGPWYYAADQCNDPAKMAELRGETWRAMEDALEQKKVRAIGVSNFTVEHLKALKKTARVWPPAVNQVEFHPAYPQEELLEYCRQEGIVVQAYASLGGQDTGAKQWQKLSLKAAAPEEEDENHETNGNSDNEEDISAAELTSTTKPKSKGKRKTKRKKLRDVVVSLLSCHPVVATARALNVTPAQILLRWSLDQNCPVIPKSSVQSRMEENRAILAFSLTGAQIADITSSVQADMARAIVGDAPLKKTVEEKQALERASDAALGRLCWRNDPLRHLDFD